MPEEAEEEEEEEEEASAVGNGAAAAPAGTAMGVESMAGIAPLVGEVYQQRWVWKGVESRSLGRLARKISDGKNIRSGAEDESKRQPGYELLRAS